jgi:DNA-binding NarL/FixJ family response regulator
MEAVETYIKHFAAQASIDQLLKNERILFCCHSRLMATLWVRSERGGHKGANFIPKHLIGSCTTITEAMGLLEAKNPSLVITTQLLEEGSGLDLLKRVKKEQPHLPTVLFLQHKNLTVFQEAIKTHSDGIVLETEMGSGHVIKALRIVSGGGMYLEPTIAEALAGSEACVNHTLTSRELEVMQQVVFGLNDREIGQALHLSADTVKYHLKQVYKKLNLHNRTRAAVSLVIMGLVAPPSPLIPE